MCDACLAEEARWEPSAVQDIEELRDILINVIEASTLCLFIASPNEPKNRFDTFSAYRSDYLLPRKLLEL